MTAWSEKASTFISYYDISWLAVSLHSNGLFLGEPGLASFTGAKGDGGGGDNWNYKTCKAPVKSSPPTNPHMSFYRLDALPVTNCHRALKGKFQDIPEGDILRAFATKKFLDKTCQFLPSATLIYHHYSIFRQECKTPLLFHNVLGFYILLRKVFGKLPFISVVHLNMHCFMQGSLKQKGSTRQYIYLVSKLK